MNNCKSPFSYLYFKGHEISKNSLFGIAIESLLIKVQLFSKNRSNLENRIQWHVRIAQEIKKHFRLRENNEVNEILIAFATVKSSSKTTIHGYIFMFNAIVNKHHLYSWSTLVIIHLIIRE